MKIKSARFVISNSDISKCPKPDRPEFALRPGKTQLINHFGINDETETPWYLVDLPGYGFAKVPVKIKNKWLGFIKGYLRNRKNLYCTFVLIDSRHEPQKVDLEFMNWLGENEIPFVIVFTKLDKLKNAEVENVVPTYKKEMLKVWEEMPQTFVTSSEKHLGKEELLEFIENVIQVSV